MALIQCPECKKEISDQSTHCIHCGYPLSVLQSNAENSNAAIVIAKPECNKAKFKSKRILMTVIAIATVLIIALIVSANALSSEEKYALRIVEKYQDMLKDPDSLKLRSDIVVIESYTEENGSQRFCYFTASGNNSYGAAITSTVCFLDGQYICKTDEFPTTEEYMEMDDDEAMLYIALQLRLTQWKLYGESAPEKAEGVIDAYSVDATKIAHKLGVSVDN